MAVSIRPARPTDAHQLYEMIVDLARYEREHSVNVTVADLGRELSEPNPPFACAMAEVEGKPAASPCTSILTQHGRAQEHFIWRISMSARSFVRPVSEPN